MHYRFPSPIVYWEQLPNHSGVKDELLPMIQDDIEWNGSRYLEKSKGVWDCNVISSYFRSSPLEFMNDNLYRSIIWEPFTRMLKEVGEVDPELPKPRSTQVMDFWYNKYFPGDFQEIHEHMSFGSTALYSGIYILEMSDDQVNPTSFFYHDLPSSYAAGRSLQYRADTLTEGSLILFPANLLHYVKPAKGERITISFNICN